MNECTTHFADKINYFRKKVFSFSMNIYLKQNCLLFILWFISHQVTCFSLRRKYTILTSIILSLYNINKIILVQTFPSQWKLSEKDLNYDLYIIEIIVYWIKYFEKEEGSEA